MKVDLGKQLAKLATDGARLGVPPGAKMCAGCAFKAGTPANGERPAAMRALEALLTQNIHFGCHEQTDRLCGGYLLAKQVQD